MNGEDGNFVNVNETSSTYESPNDKDTYELVLTRDTIIFLGPALISLCLCYICINYCFKRLKKVNPSIGDHSGKRWEIEKELWATASARASTGYRGDAGYPELSLTRFLDVSFLPSEAKWSPPTPVSKGSNESRKVKHGSLSKLLRPSLDDDGSTSHISLTSLKSMNRGDSSTIRAFKGTHHIRAPSNVRYMEWEDDELPRKQSDCRSGHLGATETSTASMRDGELVVGKGTFFSRTISLKHFTERPILMQQISHSGSYNIVQLPANTYHVQHDSWASPDEDFKVYPNFYLKSETSIDRSTQIETSRTSNSITFLKTPRDKAQSDSKDHNNTCSPDQRHNDNEENINFKDSMIHLTTGTTMSKSKTVDACTSVSLLKCNTRLSFGEEGIEKSIEDQPVGDEADVSEDSSLTIQEDVEDPDHNSQKPKLN